MSNVSDRFVIGIEERAAFRRTDAASAMRFSSTSDMDRNAIAINRESVAWRSHSSFHTMDPSPVKGEVRYQITTVSRRFHVIQPDGGDEGGRPSPLWA